MTADSVQLTRKLLDDTDTLKSAIQEIDSVPIPTHYRDRILKLTTAAYWQGVADGLNSTRDEHTA